MATEMNFQAVIRKPKGMFIKASAPRATAEDAAKDCAKLAKWAACKPSDVITIETTVGQTVSTWQG